MITPIDLDNHYHTLRTRVSIVSPLGCAEISLSLPSDFDDELAFYKLVTWGYVLLNEAARIPLSFLAKLPPLKVGYNVLRNEITTLRTYLVNNLDIAKRRGRRKHAFVHRWFMTTCGRGTPESNDHYADCCTYLADRLRELLNGAIEACNLLNDPVDGARLALDLKSRIDLEWEAHQFDPILVKCAERLGNPGLDLQKIRSRGLEAWRRALSQAEESEREHILEQHIESDLLEAIGDILPGAIREKVQRIAANTDVTVAILLLLREARRVGTMTLPEIIEIVSSQVLEKDSST